MKSRRLPPAKRSSPAYRQVWRLVDGAVRDALHCHPEYLAPGVNPRVVRNSINKRVTGALMGYAEQSAEGRSGQAPAAETEPAELTPLRFIARLRKALSRWRPALRIGAGRFLPLRGRRG